MGEYVWLSPFAVQLKLSQHCLLIGYIPLHFVMFKIKKKKKEGLPDNRMKFLMDMVIGTFRYASGDSIYKYGS